MARLSCLLILLCANLAAQTAREIIVRSVTQDDENWKRARNYTFLQREEIREFDRNETAKKTRSETWDVTMLDGSPYRRLVARNDQPLSGSDERKEQEKLRKSIEERRAESEEKRLKRIAEAEKQRAKQRELLKQIPDAFDFELKGVELLDSRPSWVLAATPRAGYEPKGMWPKILPKVRGAIWIDQQDYQWKRAEAEVIDTISFGLFLFRLGKGATLSFEQVKVNGDAWLPRTVSVRGSGKLGMVKTFRVEAITRFSEFKRFQSESRIVSSSPLEEEVSPKPASQQ